MASLFLSYFLLLCGTRCRPFGVICRAGRLRSQWSSVNFFRYQRAYRAKIRYFIFFSYTYGFFFLLTFLCGLLHFGWPSIPFWNRKCFDCVRTVWKRWMASCLLRVLLSRRLTELFLTVVGTNKNYYLYCILRPPVAAQPNKGEPSAWRGDRKKPSKETSVPCVIWNTIWMQDVCQSFISLERV